MSAPTPLPTHYLTSRGMRPIPKRALARAARLAATAAADAEVMALRAELDLPFPQTRADCPPIRPCPHISCRYHLSLTAEPHRVRVHTDPDDWTPDTSTCALDVAAQGPHSPQQIADMWGVTRQRITQIEEQALAKLRASGLDLTDLFDGHERRRPDLALAPSADWLPSSSSPAGIAITAAADRVRVEVAQVMASRTRTLSAAESAEALAQLLLHPKAPKGITCTPTSSSTPPATSSARPSPTPAPTPPSSGAPSSSTPPPPSTAPASATARQDSGRSSAATPTPSSPTSAPSSTTSPLSADDLAHITHLTSLALRIGDRP